MSYSYSLTSMGYNQQKPVKIALEFVMTQQNLANKPFFQERSKIYSNEKSAI
jgi:hypothetical protein